jgi:lysophospholipase L1-like esterase
MKKRLLLSCLLLALLSLLALTSPGRLGLPRLVDRNTFVRFAVRHMTEAQKREYYGYLAQSTPAGIFEAVPEPRVGRVLQFGVRKLDLQAEVVTNQAGMRSRRPYTPKAKDRFRIVCLGDSVVMGTAGREEDRWSDQLETILRDRGIAVGGKQVEVYNLGIGSWTAVSEATYLSQRISSYAPDLVLALMVDNDLNDVGGVLGIGQATYSFTPERREHGSSVFVDHSPLLFGVTGKNLLGSGLGPESQARWREAFRAWRRLEELLARSGGRLVFGVLRASPLFLELAKRHYVEAGLTSPFIVTEYFGQRLPHDSHPNRAGHQILAAHYLHVLARLAWLPVQPADLPSLHSNLSTQTEPRPDHEALAALQDEIARATLPARINFDRLNAEAVRALLGGIYPGSEERPLESFPFGSLRSVFLLRRAARATRLRLEVDVPPHVELYPFELSLFLDGQPAGQLSLETSARAGRHVLSGVIPGGPGPALEVALRTQAYWTGITDFTMRSYRLVSAAQE